MRTISTPLDASIMNWVRVPLVPQNIGFSSVDTFLVVELNAHQKIFLPFGKLLVRSIPLTPRHTDCVCFGSLARACNRVAIGWQPGSNPVAIG